MNAIQYFQWGGNKEVKFNLNQIRICVKDFFSENLPKWFDINKVNVKPFVSEETLKIHSSYSSGLIETIFKDFTITRNNNDLIYYASNVFFSLGDKNVISREWVINHMKLYDGFNIFTVQSFITYNSVIYPKFLHNIFNLSKNNYDLFINNKKIEEKHLSGISHYIYIGQYEGLIKFHINLGISPFFWMKSVGDIIEIELRKK